MVRSTQLIRSQTVLKDRKHISGLDETKTVDLIVQELELSFLRYSSKLLFLSKILNSKTVK
jgi:hypothetical protein